MPLFHHHARSHPNPSDELRCPVVLLVLLRQRRLRWFSPERILSQRRRRDRARLHRRHGHDDQTGHPHHARCPSRQLGRAVEIVRGCWHQSRHHPDHNLQPFERLDLGLCPRIVRFMVRTRHGRRLRLLHLGQPDIQNRCRDGIRRRQHRTRRIDRLRMSSRLRERHGDSTRQQRTPPGAFRA